jgi:hypothetical protein
VVALTTLCLVLAGGARAALPVDRRPRGGPTDARVHLDRFDVDRAMRDVRRLARGIGVRVRATKGERRATRYIAARFRRMGYRVDIQRFAVDGRTSRNVVARWPTAKRYPVIVGGHMDTVPGSPGANDNASGVAVVLEVARLVAGKRPARWTKFVAFGAEEYGSDGRHHVGSQAFVARLGRRGRHRLAGMVSVDMVAKLLGRPLIVGTAGIGPTVVARTLVRKARQAGVRATYRTTCDCSDNGPFERAGIPAAFAWSGPEPNYHSPGDTVRSISRRSLRRTGRVIRWFVRALDRRTVRRFRRLG